LAGLEALRLSYPGPLGVRSVTWETARSPPPASAAPCTPAPDQTIDRAPQRGAYLHTRPEDRYVGFGFVRDR
jgi:hypothetical protein